MTMDTRAYITVADEFPEHPKTLELSDAGFRAVVELWCYCNRRRTDGLIPSGLVRRYGKTIDELVTVGFLVIEDGQHYMHDYLSHQKSKAQIEKAMKDKKKAGSRGGLISSHKRNHVAKGVIDPTCELCPGAEPDE